MPPTVNRCNFRACFKRNMAGKSANQDLPPRLTNIILPGMLAVVSTNLANLWILGKDSAFSTMLRLLKGIMGHP